MKVEKIKVEDIISVKNIRGDSGDLHEMMNSMKHHGQLQPIAVVQCDKKYKLCFGNRRVEAALKLGWIQMDAVILPKEITEYEFDTLNYIENEHRANPSSADRGRYYHEMINKYNMTESELASRLGIPRARIKDGLAAYNFTPAEYKDRIAPFLAGRQPKEGQIPASYVTKLNTIINRHKLKKLQRMLLFEFARKDDVSSVSLDSVGYFLSVGNSLEDSLNLAREYKIIWFKVPIKEAEIEKYIKENRITKSQLGKEVFSGKRKVSFNIPGA